MSTATQEFMSTNFIATLVQVSPGKLLEWFERMEIRPAMVLNGVAHWSPEALERFRQSDLASTVGQ